MLTVDRYSLHAPTAEGAKGMTDSAQLTAHATTGAAKVATNNDAEAKVAIEKARQEVDQAKGTYSRLFDKETRLPVMRGHMLNGAIGGIVSGAVSGDFHHSFG